jgi:enoyl-CoA hydratase/carnithine racemase
MSQDLVLYETDAKVGFVTLNRPEKLNALSVDLRRELAATLTRADEDPATSVVVLRGAGRSFCVGYDLAGVPAARPGDTMRSNITSGSAPASLSS